RRRAILVVQESSKDRHRAVPFSITRRRRPRFAPFHAGEHRAERLSERLIGANKLQTHSVLVPESCRGTAHFAAFPRRRSAAYPSNLLLLGKPFGGRRPASARLPIHSLSSGFATVKVRPAESSQVRPLARAKTLASEMPPSL